MNDFGADHDFTQMNAGRRQLVITAQLYKAADNMSHINDLISWLASRIVGSFPVQVVQFWALRANRARQTSVELRNCTCQDTTFPTQIVVNNQVGATVQNLLNGWYANMSRPVENLFSSYQASMLTRFGLYYCSCSFMRSKSLIVPEYNSADAQLIPIPLAVAVLLYFRQQPSREVLSAIDLILNQAVSIAENRFLRLSDNTSPEGVSAGRTKSFQQHSSQSLYELIPQRSEDDKVLTANNPLSGSNVIRDKQARRVYDAVNGTRNVKEICEHLRINLQEAYEAMRILAAQNRLQLYETGGQPVDISVFTDHFEQP